MGKRLNLSQPANTSSRSDKVRMNASPNGSACSCASTTTFLPLSLEHHVRQSFDNLDVGAASATSATSSGHVWIWAACSDRVRRRYVKASSTHLTRQANKSHAGFGSGGAFGQPQQSQQQPQQQSQQLQQQSQSNAINNMKRSVTASASLPSTSLPRNASPSIPSQLVQSSGSPIPRENFTPQIPASRPRSKSFSAGFSSSSTLKDSSP